MGKDKLRRFQENETFRCLVQPKFESVFHRDHALKGNWGPLFFGNSNPIVLELGCGRGEYTVSLGGLFPDRNFIGVDIKGARMWRGAKTATEAGLSNVGFLRTRIEVIESFFAPGEISEIWITFPDPQLKSQRAKKRLTAPEFLTKYAGFLTPEGVVHLKTDSLFLHNYTRRVIAMNELSCAVANPDIYGSGAADEILSVKTHYEQQFLSQGLPITYLQFSLGSRREFSTPPEE